MSDVSRASDNTKGDIYYLQSEPSDSTSQKPTAITLLRTTHRLGPAPGAITTLFFFSLFLLLKMLHSRSLFFTFHTLTFRVTCFIFSPSFQLSYFELSKFKMSESHSLEASFFKKFSYFWLFIAWLLKVIIQT